MTSTCGPIHKNADGSFQELMRVSKIDCHIEQISVLKINKGAERGNHYHTRKREWFACIEGRVDVRFENQNGDEWSIRLDQSDEKCLEVPLNTKHWVINPHRYFATVIIFCNEEYDEEDHDTWKEWK